MKRRIVAFFCLFSIMGGIVLTGCGEKTGKNGIIKPNFTSLNFMAGAVITYESLKKKETPDAENLFSDDDKAWTPEDLNRSPAEGQEDVCNSTAEIKLQEPEYLVADEVKITQSFYNLLLNAITH